MKTAKKKARQTLNVGNRYKLTLLVLAILFLLSKVYNNCWGEKLIKTTAIKTIDSKTSTEINKSQLQLDIMSKNIQFRSIFKHFVALEQEEGVGARVRRSIGSMQLRRFSPFLMLDHFTVNAPAGFPDHPHHGQETITYVLGGMIAHEDFSGSKGVLSAGDLQFMTAGKGIVHSEMPVKMDNGEPAVGLQLWVDLPKDMKNYEPRYRDLRSKQIPVAQPKEHLKVRVISGSSYGVESKKDLAYTPVHFYHYEVSKKGTTFEQEFPKTFNVFMYIMKGSVTIGDKVFPPFSSVFFNDDGDAIKGSSATDEAEFALIGGEILHQETVQHGPFVETNRENLLKVFQNYQYNINGFERAQNWRSSIADGISESEARKLNAK